MPLRVAFDLDGVLADMEGALAREAEGVFGEAMVRRLMDDAFPSPDPTSEKEKPSDGMDDRKNGEADSRPTIFQLHMTTRQQRRLWRHIETVDDFWESLAEIEPGAVKRLGTIAAERRWEVIFLTKRPASGGATAQVQTQRWLESKGFPLPSVYVVQGSRGRIASALDLDFVVDDRPENCLEVVVDSRARAILVWREDEHHLPPGARRLGIGVVDTVDECLNILTQLDVPAAERTGVLDRVMRLFGIKDSPAS